jgi:hypothetical protein
MASGGWLPSQELIAQEVHLAFGLGVTFGARALGFPAWWGAAAIIIIDLVKANTFDRWVEKEPFFTDGLEDWSFYIVGAALAAGLLVIRFGSAGLLSAP